MSLPDNPNNREETYLAAMAGQAVNLPKAPLNRKESYLDYIAKNGGSGGVSYMVNVKELGAVGDGVIDNSTVFSEAFTLASTTGKVLYIPEGTYLIDWGKIRVDMTALGLAITGDGKYKSVIKLKDTHNDGKYGNGITLRNPENPDIHPDVSFTNIGIVYDNDDDTLSFPYASRQILLAGYFGNVTVDNVYMHIGGTASVLPRDTCIFWHIDAKSITISNSLFENFTNNADGGAVWLMPDNPDNADLYNIEYVSIHDNEFLTTNKDEAIAIYTASDKLSNGIHDVDIRNNNITHKSWTENTCHYTNGLIALYIGNTSLSPVDASITIDNNNLYSELANQELIRIVRLNGVYITNNVLTVAARYSTGGLSIIKAENSNVLIQNNICDYSAITAEVAMNADSDATVAWISNTIKAGAKCSINPYAQATILVSNNIIYPGTQLVIRQNNSTATYNISHNIVYGTMGLGSLVGGMVNISDNVFNAMTATETAIDFNAAATTSLIFIRNKGISLRCNSANISSPFASFTYVGSTRNRLFVVNGQSAADSETVRELFFTACHIDYTDGAPIDDDRVSAVTTYSSEKIEALIADVLARI